MEFPRRLVYLNCLKTMDFADTGRDAVKVNWDVYYAAGCPEINSVDDLIPVMKKMMEIKPEADDGTKTWGDHTECRKRCHLLG